MLLSHELEIFNQFTSKNFLSRWAEFLLVVPGISIDRFFVKKIANSWLDQSSIWLDQSLDRNIKIIFEANKLWKKHFVIVFDCMMREWKLESDLVRKFSLEQKWKQKHVVIVFDCMMREWKLETDLVRKFSLEQKYGKNRSTLNYL